jgi:hypothetical protein
MRTQVRMSAPMGARLTSHFASPLVVATPGRVAHWLRVKAAYPEEGRESERERERGERLLHFAARGNKKERTTNAHCAFDAERKRKRENRRRGEKKRVRPGLRPRFSLSFASGDRYAIFSCTLSSVFFLFF